MRSNLGKSIDREFAYNNGGKTMAKLFQRSLPLAAMCGYLGMCHARGKNNVVGIFHLRNFCSRKQGKEPTCVCQLNHQLSKSLATTTWNQNHVEIHFMCREVGSLKLDYRIVLCRRWGDVIKLTKGESPNPSQAGIVGLPFVQNIYLRVTNLYSNHRYTSR